MVSMLLPCASMARTVQAVDALAVDDDGAGAAGAAVADPLGAGEIEVIAQRVEQGDARLDGEVDGFAVDVERDGDRAGSDDIGGGRRGLGFSFEEACSHGARTDAHAAEKSAAGDSVLGFRVFR